LACCAGITVLARAIDGCFGPDHGSKLRRVLAGHFSKKVAYSVVKIMKFPEVLGVSLMCGFFGGVAL